MPMMFQGIDFYKIECRAHISGCQTPGSTRGSPPFYITIGGGERRVQPGVLRPEMWAQNQYTVYINVAFLLCTVHLEIHFLRSIRI
jgi:hypothetical protein